MKNNVLVSENFLYCKLEGSSIIKFLNGGIPDAHHCFDKYPFPLQWKSYRELLPSHMFRKCTTACKKRNLGNTRIQCQGRKKREATSLCFHHSTVIFTSRYTHYIFLQAHQGWMSYRCGRYWDHIQNAC